jgi:hypothetical protein
MVKSMLIAEIRHNDALRRIGIVGSCRLHDPLKAAILNAGGKFVWSAHNAFTHSPQEALQHFNFCSGRMDIPDVFAPFILRQDHTPALPDTLPELIASCDTLAIEISSFDTLGCGGYFFSQDYFAQTFVRGKGLALLEWFRNIGAVVPPHDIVAAAEAGLAEAGISLTPARREILQTLRRMPYNEQQSTDALRVIAGMAENILLVPIFNLADGPKHLQEARADVSRHLKHAATQVDADFADPSAIIANFPREIVLEGGGADVFHLAPGFLLTIGISLLDKLLTGKSARLIIPTATATDPSERLLPGT